MAGAETEGWSRILHRTDDRGVIVDSQVFGPDDEIPEGFGVAEYQPVYAPREDDQEPVAEVNQTQWENPVGKGGWVQDRPEDAEIDEGTPVQARDEDELTDAEKEALAAVNSDEDGDDEKPDEVDEGSPRQAREDDLTEAEVEQDEQAEESVDESSEPEVDAGTPVQALGDAVQPPPHGGPGSGREAWAQYAAAQGVSVPEDASRDDIIAKVKAAGKPVA